MTITHGRPNYYALDYRFPAPPELPGQPVAGDKPREKEGEQPPPPPPPPSVQTQNRFDVTFSADRTKLFTAWNAAAKLADLAGQVTVTSHAENDAGLDKGKLQNGVIEPLREADLIE